MELGLRFSDQFQLYRENMLTDLDNSEWLLCDECEVNNYLYQSRARSQPVFHRIEKDMAQLNDFCLLCIQGTDRAVTELQEHLHLVRSGEVHWEPDFEDGDFSRDNYADQLEKYDIPRYQEMQRFMVCATSLLLLAAFEEKYLKELAHYLAPPGAPPYKRKGGGGEILPLMSYLKDTCALDFEEPEASRLVRERCRDIRNDFAHGRWDNVNAAIADYPLRGAFVAVTSLFDAIDAAFRRSNPDHASANEEDPFAD